METMLQRPRSGEKFTAQTLAHGLEPNRVIGQFRYIRRAYEGHDIHNNPVRNEMSKLPLTGWWLSFGESASQSLTVTFGNLILAFAGGASLLVPIIIMTFTQSRDARLIVVSVATILFATIVALVATSRENTLPATAAYAAVMVAILEVLYQVHKFSSQSYRRMFVASQST